MKLNELRSVRNKLGDFVSEFKEFLGRSERIHWCEMYLSGLLLEGERKSIEPMANRLPGGDKQAMQQFVNQSPWEHEELQLHLARYLTKKIKITKAVLVLDDTSLPKKGNNSVGVARQYCGALGKIANCQSIVTWQYAVNGGDHFPIVEELYLPDNWTSDTKRLEQAGVPQKRFKFKKKWEIALDLLSRLDKLNLAYEAIVFDAGYGEIKEFWRKLDAKGKIFVAQIPESHSFWSVDIELNNKQPRSGGRRRLYPEVTNKEMKALSAKKWGEQLIGKKRDVWKKVKLPLSSKPHTLVRAIRVKEVITEAYYRPGRELWLLIEKFGNDQYKYYISNASKDTSIKKLTLWAHERWKVEQGYQHLKEELGLDHFEGRSWLGLHHHITLCFMAYAFLLLLKKDRFKKNPKSNNTAGSIVV